MLKVLVDTDVLIDFSKGHPGVLEELFKKQAEGRAELFINPVIVAEFYTDKNLRNKQKLAKAEEFLRFFKVANISAKAGIAAGELLRENRAGFLGDALIAATAVTEELKPATGNKRHFGKVLGLEFYT